MPIVHPDRDELPTGLLNAELLVDEVLYEADYPILYITRTAQDQPLLAYVADDTAEGITTLLAPISSAQIDLLRCGGLGIREALTSSWLWMHFFDGERRRLWATTVDEIPAIHLPVAGTPLLPQHEPVFRTRAIGDQLELGRMPASVVAFVADATRKALKTILDFKFEARSEGRPTEEHRALYDLPIQQFAFASFELSFGPPDEGLFPHEAVKEAALLLAQGLQWAGDVGIREPFQGATDDERAAVLRAAMLLTPPLTGAITEVQVSGRWIPGERIRLTRESRRKVKSELRTVAQDHVVAYNGRIGEFDRDNLSFILRDTDDGQDRKAFIAEDQVDDVHLYFLESIRLTVAGIERQGRLYVAAIAPYDV
jgi:hypothetical protein